MKNKKLQEAALVRGRRSFLGIYQVKEGKRDYLFAGTRRKTDGSIEYMETPEERKGDAVSFAAAPDCGFIWVNNKKTAVPGRVFRWKKLKYHGLN